MKNVLWFFSILSLSLSFSGCSKDDPSPSDPEYIINIMTKGTWRLTYFLDSDVEKTGQFSGYKFTFTTSGVLLAEKDSTKVVGYWSAVKESDDIKLIVSFQTPQAFYEMSNAWIVLESTDTKVRLVVVNTSGNSPDYLTFEKE